MAKTKPTAKVKTKAKIKARARVRPEVRSKTKVRANAKSDVVCLVGAELRRELSRRDKDHVFERVRKEWEGLKASHWTDSRLAALDSEIVEHVFVVAVEEKPRRYHYRFVGAALADLHGQDYGGQYLHELRLDEVADFVADAFGRAVKSREPVLFRGAFVTLSGTHVVAERLVLPLSSDGRRCDTLLCALSLAADQPGTAPRTA